MEGNWKLIATLIASIIVPIIGVMIALYRQTDKRIDDLHQQTNKHIDDLHRQTDKRIDDLHQQTNKRIDDLRDEMNQRFDVVNAHIDALRGDIKEIREDLRMLISKLIPNRED